MGKCLVTKLQGVVNDNSLLKVGEMRFTLAQAGYIYLSTAQTVRNLTAGTSQNVPAGSLTLLTGSWGDTISVPNKYDVVGITIGGGQPSTDTAIPYSNINLNDLKYSESLTTLKAKWVYGDIGSLKGKHLAEFNIIGNGLYGDISQLQFGEEITDFRVLVAPEVTGDIISKIGSLTNVTNINIYSTGLGGTLTTSSVSNLTSLKAVAFNENPAMVCNIENLILPSSVTYFNIIGQINFTGSAEVFKANNPNVSDFYITRSGVSA